MGPGGHLKHISTPLRLLFLFRGNCVLMYKAPIELVFLTLRHGQTVGSQPSMGIGACWPVLNTRAHLIPSCRILGRRKTVRKTYLILFTYRLQLVIVFFRLIKLSQNANSYILPNRLIDYLYLYLNLSRVFPTWVPNKAGGGSGRDVRPMPTHYTAGPQFFPNWF